jgi:hypothetical protein
MPEYGNHQPKDRNESPDTDGGKRRPKAKAAELDRQPLAHSGDRLRYRNWPLSRATGVWRRGRSAAQFITTALCDITARNQFLYANVLVGLSMLLQDRQSPKNNDENAPSIEARIEETTRALAPFILALTGLGQQDLSEGDDLDGLEAATG